MSATSSGSRVKRNFILQQGLAEPSAAACPAVFSALHFQPRLVAFVLFAAVVLQAPWIFFILAGVLWWGALFPRWNLFDALYNRTVAVRAGRAALSPAPSPRRFAQGTAGTLALIIGVALVIGWQTVAIAVEIVLSLAVGLLAFSSFCVGSFLFHLLSGRRAFATRTLPWGRGA